MNPLIIFAIGLGFTVAAAFAVAWYLKPHLKAILIDLCGNEVRASFWMAFSIICFVVVPLIFSLGAYPESADDSVLALQFVEQFKWALIGLIATVGSVGTVLWSFIGRVPPSLNQLPKVQEGGPSNANRH